MSLHLNKVFSNHVNMNDLDDFWKELFHDEILWFFVGPISTLSILFINLGFIGILYFIKERNIKYVTYWIFLLFCFVYKCNLVTELCCSILREWYITMVLPIHAFHFYWMFFESTWVPFLESFVGGINSLRTLDQ